MKYLLALAAVLTVVAAAGLSSLESDDYCSPYGAETTLTQPGWHCVYQDLSPEHTAPPDADSGSWLSFFAVLAAGLVLVLVPRDPGQGARAGRRPGQHRCADGDGHRLRRPEPHLQHRHLDPGLGRLLLAPVVPVEQDRPGASALPRPSQIDLGSFTTPADPAGT